MDPIEPIPLDDSIQLSLNVITQINWNIQKLI